MSLVKGVRMEGITVLAHPAATVRQKLVWVRWADRPVIADVRVEGERATVGIEMQECRNPMVLRPKANRIKDLANSVVNTYEGYGVRFRGCLNGLLVDAIGDGCRHLFDDSSITDTATGIREVPSLRSHVKGGVSYRSPSSGWSTHGGSRRCFFDGTVAVDCGGGFIVRGEAAKGRNIIVDGVRNPATDDYTALGGAAQSYKDGLTVGELAGTGTTGGITSPGGIGLDWEFLRVDMTGGDSTCSAIGGQYADWRNARVKWGRMVLVNDAPGLVARFTDTFRNVQILGGDVINTGTSKVVYIESRFSADGRAPQDVLVTGLDVDGYNTTVVDIVGNPNQNANASKGIRIVGNRAKNKNAAYGIGSSVWRLNGGCFSTNPGSVVIADNEALESNPSGIKVDGVNGGAGPTTGLTQYGNLSATGYDGVLGRKVAAPATAAAAGVPGQWATDTSWAYFCTAANTWRRAAIASW